MNGLHLVRIKLDRLALMRFANDQGLLRDDDEGFGYALHAWLAAMFGVHAPRPFRLMEDKGELLGYAKVGASILLEHAQAFAPAQAWAALLADSLMSKPMPAQWRCGQRLSVDVMLCPTTRKEGREKDVFLRVLDRLGDEAPRRAEVYIEWFRRQWGEAVAIERAQLLGFARRKMLRRAKAAGAAIDAARRVRSIERPQALFQAIVEIKSPDAFGNLLSRGLGRHRAFGFGMLLLKPAT